nr:hypothetical protein [uncultured Desulfobacter sp.]
MKSTLHITSGDMAGELLTKSAIEGDVFVWHDILYDGPRKPGWPDDATLDARAGFLADITGGGLSTENILGTLEAQYAKLKTLRDYDSVVLWFDACLFDQSMLCHILACMHFLGHKHAELLCIDAFPGIEPYHGLGQLSADQLASMYSQRQPLTSAQFVFAGRVDCAFACQDQDAFRKLARADADAPLPWIPAAVARWMAESPDEETGLGQLEKWAIEAICSGIESPQDIFTFVAERDTPPQYWGDVTLWAKINALAGREPPLVKIEGPEPRLPQWGGLGDLNLFRVLPHQ